MFIDEIDAVSRKRGAGRRRHDEREQTLNQLLVEMDGFGVKKGLSSLRATNRPDILIRHCCDQGDLTGKLLRSSDIKGREEILKVHARNKPLADDVDLKVLARRTPGLTPGRS